MWGCFPYGPVEVVHVVVFPTHVGVFPSAAILAGFDYGLPHACGGVSITLRCIVWLLLSSPRMWGCFLASVPRPRPIAVFPTHVGVFLERSESIFVVIRLPHACGGVSMVHVKGVLTGQSSPRMWGCFFIGPVSKLTLDVFPTHVGVFLDNTGCSHLDNLSSPRMWGCFRNSGPQGADVQVFPTHVGVFLVIWFLFRYIFCLPHACGGVSFSCPRERAFGMSSPRMWGCFLARDDSAIYRLVFPTHVGVFLMGERAIMLINSLPHACGGVSQPVESYFEKRKSSPRMWGCFCSFYPLLFFVSVFPTHVGVFLWAEFM